MFEITKPRC